MNDRTWLNDVLRLHFGEGLTRVAAGRQLGIPKSTVCKFFARFTEHGLHWPLPGHMTCRKLEKRLYSLSSGQTPRPEPSPERKCSRRPNFPHAFKVALVERSLQPGISVAQLARESGINDNQLFNWRHLWKQGKLAKPQQAEASLLFVSIAPPLPQASRKPLHL